MVRNVVQKSSVKMGIEAMETMELPVEHGGKSRLRGSGRSALELVPDMYGARPAVCSHPV